MKKRLVLLMALSLTFAFPAAVMAEDTTAAEETADDTEAADSTAVSYTHLTLPTTSRV